MADTMITLAQSRDLDDESVATENVDERCISIRAFLARTIPLRGCSYVKDDAFWLGKNCIERLAMAYDEGAENTWDLIEMAAVAKYLHSIEPAKGVCYCGDHLYDDVSLACGVHLILGELEDNLRVLAGKAVKRGVPRA